MDIGILLLRLLLAAVLFAHATQKSIGWFQGNGLAKQSGLFEALGLKPGRVMVLMASVAELAAAALLALGLLTPLGALIAAGTMLVAGLTMHLTSGKFWNVAAGGEYPYVLALLALALAFTGPGAYSVDASIDTGLLELAHTPPSWVGVVVLVAAVVAALPFVAVLRRNQAASAG